MVNYIDGIEKSEYFYDKVDTKQSVSLKSQNMGEVLQRKESNELDEEENQRADDAACEEKKDDAKESFAKLSSNSEKLKALIAQQNEELSERIKNGEDESSFQIGASSMTQKEWGRLLKKVDNVLDAIKERQKKEEEQKLEKKKTDKQKAQKQEKQKMEKQRIEKQKVNKQEVQKQEINKEEIKEGMKEVRSEKLKDKRQE